ncbi:hypothetical protein OsI_36825 [Oryza sativa Indica Group]|uniref:Uncharacterized protein n=1 Tax=Oryza sativa subsp. indica TaxID=39946 RepID=B8BLJ7_ORYSI|nr:hypothetical protein OsI_36825 [Oryza sativa Indica Group]
MGHGKVAKLAYIVFAEEDVARFEITMDDWVGLGVVEEDESGAYAGGSSHSSFPCEPPPLSTFSEEEASPWWWRRENGEGIPIQFRGSFSLEMPLLWSALEGFLPEAASPATFRRAAWLALVWRMEQRRSVHSAVSRVAGADSFWAGEPSRCGS